MQNDLLIYFNERKFNSEVRSLNDTITYFEKVIKLYTRLEIEELKKGEFMRLLFDTDNFLFEKIMKDKPAEFAGMKIDKRTFYDQFLIKPLGYSELIKEIELFIRRIGVSVKYPGWENSDVKTHLLSFFSPLDNGKFELRNGIIEDERKRNEVFVSSEKAKRAYKLATDLQKLLNEDNLLNKISISSNKDLGNFISDLFLPIETDTKDVEIKIEFIKRLDTRSF